ncbi:phosphonatase-like hydrolase [Brevibacterium sp. 5221]|uniref:Phosphonatase-like hydrolase n=1 Tax=Brevibacterium rongguiense TaxID=2695267 RepID=A0A6N9H8Z6_9MICO|nr:phosphonatase-like hydrolase [Brevibacterium rongguiense]MYM20301.1 phosphonatase-like hydrolase [Brevibacterium rongguiense]
MPQISLAAFDIAGTTVDEHGGVYRVLREAVEETGAAVTDEGVQTWMGADKTEAISHLMSEGGVEPTAERVEAAFARFKELLAQRYREDPPVALPGAEDTMRALRAAGAKVALTTGFSADVAEPLLAQLGWKVGEGELLDALITADTVAAGRPYPYKIFSAMEATGTAAVGTVVVAGDTRVDVEAGRNAGAAHVIGVLTGKLERPALEAAGATAVLDSLADLPAHLGL